MHLVCDSFISETHVPVVNIDTGLRLSGDQAPKVKNLGQWLSAHPKFVLDIPSSAGITAASNPTPSTSGVKVAETSEKTPSSTEQIVTPEKTVVKKEDSAASLQTSSASSDPPKVSGLSCLYSYLPKSGGVLPLFSCCVGIEVSRFWRFWKTSLRRHHTRMDHTGFRKIPHCGTITELQLFSIIKLNLGICWSVNGTFDVPIRFQRLSYFWMPSYSS